MTEPQHEKPKLWQVSAKIPTDIYDAICKEAIYTQGGNVSAHLREILTAHVNAKRRIARTT